MEKKPTKSGDYYRHFVGRAFWGLLLFAGLIPVVLWALAVRFLPDGWWIAATNIIGFLVTIVFIGLGTWQTLKMVMPSPLAFFLGVSVWFVMAVLLRSFILYLLGG